MKLTRRKLLATSATASAALAAAGQSHAATAAINPPPGMVSPPVSDDALVQAAAQPVLDLKRFKDPVIIESIQLLKHGRDYFVRVRSKDGAEGIAVDDGRASVLHPILQQLVIPYFMLHFASCVPKIGPWQEYKEGVKQYGAWFNPPLRIADGVITVPKGPGVGIVEPKEVLKAAEVVKG